MHWLLEVVGTQPDQDERRPEKERDPNLIQYAACTGAVSTEGPTFRVVQRFSSLPPLLTKCRYNVAEDEESLLECDLVSRHKFVVVDETDRAGPTFACLDQMRSGCR
jgi:hypothetical protein